MINKPLTYIKKTNMEIINLTLEFILISTTAIVIIMLVGFMGWDLYTTIFKN